MLVALVVGCSPFAKLMGMSPASSAPWVGESFSGLACTIGKNKNLREVYDYRTDKTKLTMVDNAHFTYEVEHLLGGATSRGANGDLHFTLSVFPNHHRALNSVIRFQLQATNKAERDEMNKPAECYLQRAITFSPNDGIVHMLYAILLHKSDKESEALAEYRLAEKLMPTNANVQYNLGLLLVDMENYEEARAYADQLYTNGFPLPGLKNKLKSAGHWE